MHDLTEILTVDHDLEEAQPLWQKVLAEVVRNEHPLDHHPDVLDDSLAGLVPEVGRELRGNKDDGSEIDAGPGLSPDQTSRARAKIVRKQTTVKNKVKEVRT